MRVLALSTYELGAQPLGLALPAALLGAAGHEVRCRDLSLEPLADEDIAWADAAWVSVPMHTALRLALPVLERLRGRPEPVPVALHGLYAPVAAEAGLLERGDLAAAGESGPAMLAWLGALPGGGPRGCAGTSQVRVELGPVRAAPLVPARSGLPGLDRYARFVGGPAGGGERLVGTLETTRGCSHRCRHCPVPVVYDGRTRLVELASVLSDVDALVALGAQHLHVADPDFLNRPAHAMAAARAVHERHPGLSFDVTVKVSHVLAHAALWDALAECGCAFVTTAVESMSPLVLERLDKGHRPADAGLAVGVLRASGIEMRPSLLPFTPWTRGDDLVALLDFVAENDLVWNVDPVQWTIRLLLPPGSLLLSEPDPALSQALAVRARQDRSLEVSAAALGVRWAHHDPALDELQLALAAEVERAEAAGEGAEQAYASVRHLVFSALGRADPGAPPPASRSAIAGPLRPRLTEAWFCCAEPNAGQIALAGARPAAATVGACGQE